MAAPAKRIEIGAEDRLVLERLVRSRTAERRTVEPARIVLAAAAGRPAARIANEIGCSERTVWKWRRRFDRAWRPGDDEGLPSQEESLF